MTSKSAPRSCFVYITLPGEMRAVTAAKYELTHAVTGPIGRFIYGRNYLARPNAVEIDPVELTLGAKVEPTTKLNGLYGALRDASPDRWGRLIIERALRKTQLDEMDYLIHSSNARVGALAFGYSNAPPGPDRELNTVLALAELQETALAILADKDENIAADARAEQARRLLLQGTAMGGARPKAVIEDEEGLWIAKFNKPTDRWDSALVEHATLQLAKACGIAVAHSKITTIGHSNVLLVKRFDRERAGDDYRRARMVSALTLLRSEDTQMARGNGEWSYLRLVERLRQISSDPRRDARELFRRMVFNAAASNTDDHARNHAVIAMDKHWKLSPAYDLTPTPHIGQERYLAMIAGDQGARASAENLLSQAPRFLMELEEAQALATEVARCVRDQWYGIARREHVTEGDCEAIRPSFENEGFHFGASLTPRKKKPATSTKKASAKGARDKGSTRKSAELSTAFSSGPSVNPLKP
jgi:serine/threonine-protein kinase HipA